MEAESYRYKDRWCWCSMVSRLMACFMGLMFKPHQRCDGESFGPPSPWQLSDLCCSTASFKTGKLLLWYPSISLNCNPQICSCTYFYHTFWGNKLPSMWERDLQSYPRWLPWAVHPGREDHLGTIIVGTWFDSLYSLFRSCFEGWDFHICLSDPPFVGGENYWKLLIGANRNKTSTVGEM